MLDPVAHCALSRALILVVSWSGADFCRKLKEERRSMQDEAEQLRSEIEELNDEIR